MSLAQDVAQVLRLPEAWPEHATVIDVTALHRPGADGADLLARAEESAADLATLLAARFAGAEGATAQAAPRADGVSDAVAREALRLAYAQHKAFATTLKGRQRQRTVGDLFKQSRGGDSIVDNRALDLLVASGGVLSHAPRMEQTALMLIDAFEPEGVTELAKDSIFMMPHLGVLSSVNARAALEVFERDCLVRLGTCVALCDAAPDGEAFRVRLRGETFAVAGGAVKLARLGPGEAEAVEVTPAGRLDVGAGPGQTLRRTVRGGTVGLVFDARGRPLAVPKPDALAAWLRELEVYSSGGEVERGEARGGEIRPT